MGLKVFFSYCTKDSEEYKIADIAHRLQNMTEVDDVKFWEEHAIGSIPEYMKEYVKTCDVFVLFCSPNSLKSDPVIREWKNALFNKRLIVPIFYDIEHVPIPLKDTRGCVFKPFQNDKNQENLCNLIQKIEETRLAGNEEQQALLRQKELEYQRKIKALENELHHVKATAVSKIEASQKITKSISKSTYHKIEFSKEWPPHVNLNATQRLRTNMVEKMQGNSNMANFISENVLNAMKVVPRELFVNKDILTKRLKKNISESEFQNACYNYDSAMPAASTCSVSSPEVIASQLSVVKITPNNRVLFVGAKGGYLESIAAELVGAGGSIVVYSADDEVLKHTFETCVFNTPYAEIMKFMKTDNVFDIEPIRKYSPFNTIIVCGAITRIPTQFVYLLAKAGILLAPVGSQDHQKYNTLEERDGDYLQNEIEDFGVIFGPVR